MASIQITKSAEKYLDELLQKQDSYERLLFLDGANESGTWGSSESS